MVALRGQAYAPCAGRKRAVEELGGRLLSHMAENNLSAGSFPPQKGFLGLFSGRESCLVIPFAEADFALNQSLWTWTRFTILHILSVKPAKSTTEKEVLKQQPEISKNVIASYSGLWESVRLRVREQDLKEAKMFIKSSLKKGLSEKVAHVLGLGELPVTICTTQKPQGSVEGCTSPVLLQLSDNASPLTGTWLANAK